MKKLLLLVWLPAFAQAATVKKEISLQNINQIKVWNSSGKVVLEESENAQLKVIADIRPGESKDCTLLTETKKKEVLVLARNNYWPETQCVIDLRVQAPKSKWKQVSIHPKNRNPQSGKKAKSSPKSKKG